MCQFHDQPHHSLDFRRLIVAHNFPTTTFSRKWQFKHVQQTSSNFKICRLVFVCQSCTTECCSRAFFIKELSNLFVHARICDHILINISHVASVISSFRSPSNKESSWNWKTLCTQHFTLNTTKENFLGRAINFLFPTVLRSVPSQHVHWWECIKIMKEFLSCLDTSLASASKSVEFL